jgi:hypothetical protein
MVRINLNGYGNRAIEAPGQPFATMQRRGGAILDGFATGNADGVALDLDLEVRLADIVVITSVMTTISSPFRKTLSGG